MDDDSEFNIFRQPGSLIPTYLATQLSPLPANEEEAGHYCYEINSEVSHYILFIKLESGDKDWYWVNDKNEVGISPSLPTI